MTNTTLLQMVASTIQEERKYYFERIALAEKELENKNNLSSLIHYLEAKKDVEEMHYQHDMMLRTI